MPSTSLFQSPNCARGHQDTTDNDTVVTPADSTSGNVSSSSGQGQILTTTNYVSTWSDNDGPADSTVATGDDDHIDQPTSDLDEDFEDAEDHVDNSQEGEDCTVSPSESNGFDSADMLDSDGAIEEDDNENNFSRD